jgi:hypothetical protein
VADKQFRDGCVYYNSGTTIYTEYALIPEEGAELFKTKAGKGVGSQQTVYFRVNTKKPVRSSGSSFRPEAVGTRYSQAKTNTVGSESTSWESALGKIINFRTDPDPTQKFT